MTPRFCCTEPTLEIGFASVQGTRARQEDAGAVCRTRLAVFDGLGGHGGGDQAALAAAKVFADPQWRSLEETLRMANWAVLDVRRQASAWERAAATTVAAVEFSKQGGWSVRNGLGKGSERHLTVAWAGDSRVYLLRATKPAGERLVQLTRDHHNGDTLTACLDGGSSAFQTAVVPTSQGDLVVLTTDGLHHLVPDLEQVL